MAEHDIQIVGKTGRGHQTIVSVDGREMRLADACAAFGLSRAVVSGRLRLGWSAHDALTTPAKPHTRNLTFHGRTMSIAAWARETGMRVETIRARLSAGYSVADALTLPLSTPGKPVTIDGRTQTISEWCGELGLNYGSVAQRVYAGMSHYDALTRPFRRGNDLKRRARENGVPYWTACTRYYRLGWDIDRATTTPTLAKTSHLSARARPVKVAGERMTQSAASRKLGGGPDLVGSRLRRGWDVDEATCRTSMTSHESGQLSSARKRAKELAEMGIVF